MQQLLRRPHIRRFNKTREAVAQKVFGFETQRLNGGRGVKDPATLGDPQDHIGHMVGQHTDAGFALHERLFPQPGLRDVHGDAQDRSHLPRR